MSTAHPKACLVALLLLATVFPLTSCTSYSDVISAPVTASKWVVSWGASPENALPTATNAGGTEQSFRFLFSPTVSGTQERVHFSNYFGTGPITIGAARLAVSPNDTAAIDPAHDAALTFSGAASVTIPAGGSVVSDAANVTYSFGQKLAVSIYVKGSFGALTQHKSDVQTNYASAINAGDTTGDAAGTSFATQMTEWFLLSEVDVYGPYRGTAVLFGSSSIDGHNSNFGNGNSYPVSNSPVPGQDSDRPSDWLARQLHDAGYSDVGVANAGVTADPAGPNSGATPATGIANGIDREARDVLQLPGVTTMITYIGAVDIKTSDCKSAPDVESYLTTIIAQAAAVNVRVIVGTLPPSTFCSNPAQANYGPIPSGGNPYAGGAEPGPINPGETQRMLVNAWIRTTAVNLPGVVGIADFDKVLADPSHPSFLLPNLNSGDNTHPNGVGYGVQSSAIPLGKILP